jgi:hypothetical protein
VALCQRAGPARCALARHAESVAQRVAGLFRQARRTPIPAPHASPPGVLSYGDLLLSTFQPLRAPQLWPQYAQELDAAASGDASALETAARQLRTPAAFSKATTSAAIQCLDGTASEPVSAWPRVIPEHAVGTGPGLVELGSLRGELARARHRALQGPVERQD